jgi:hypothetical protein
MTKIFIGGSRKISRLNAEVRCRLDRIFEQALHVMVGDANGADKSVQAYFKNKNYGFVEVFCAGKTCRNNVGQWPTRMISAENLKGFDFYAAKDRVMADEATHGLMIWDGESIGTLMNVVRLIRGKKPVAVFVQPAKKFVDLHNAEEFRYFLVDYGSEVRTKLESQAASELKLIRDQSQISLL